MIIVVVYTGGCESEDYSRDSKEGRKLPVMAIEEILDDVVIVEVGVFAFRGGLALASCCAVSLPL